jgi:LmbE family N-acetylglucosaminyl deacetylase
MTTKHARGHDSERLRVAVIVAHPDDETLWAGGTILANPGWSCFVAATCRRSDPDRAPKFRRALHRLGAAGDLADLDDGPEQAPLPCAVVQDAIASLLPREVFDVVLTHGPQGEYTRHERHEEVSRSVAALWRNDGINARELWLFAYDDEGGRHLPRPVQDAHRRERLADDVWSRKYAIITETYGFAPDSFEARTTPREEAFWCFNSVLALDDWLPNGGDQP